MFLQGEASPTKIKALYTYLETQKIKDTINSYYSFTFNLNNQRF